MTYAITEAMRLIPELQTQRQDSTMDQVDTVMGLARRAGCYDAEDLLKRLLKNNEQV